MVFNSVTGLSTMKLCLRFDGPGADFKKVFLRSSNPLGSDHARIPQAHQAWPSFKRFKVKPSLIFGSITVWRFGHLSRLFRCDSIGSQVWTWHDKLQSCMDHDGTRIMGHRGSSSGWEAHLGIWLAFKIPGLKDYKKWVQLELKSWFYIFAMKRAP